MREMLTKKTKKKGFTLIELIIVLAIIAIIGAIAIPNFTKIRTESKTKADTQSAETIRRITLTLMVEDKILPGDTFDVTKGAATKPSTSTKLTAAQLSEYFKEVKAPQQDNVTKYVVTTVDGNVKVVVGKVTVDQAGPVETPDTTPTT